MSWKLKLCVLFNGMLDFKMLKKLFFFNFPYPAVLSIPIHPARGNVTNYFIIIIIIINVVLMLCKYCLSVNFPL